MVRDMLIRKKGSCSRGAAAQCSSGSTMRYMSSRPCSPRNTENHVVTFQHNLSSNMLIEIVYNCSMLHKTGQLSLIVMSVLRKYKISFLIHFSIQRKLLRQITVKLFTSGQHRTRSSHKLRPCCESLIVNSSISNIWLVQVPMASPQLSVISSEKNICIG